MPKSIKIANGQGFWGDSVDAPVKLIKNSSLDYLTLDYLAEVTMAIMQKQYNRDSKAGFASDFVLFVENHFNKIIDNNIKIITNAGGVNPHRCAKEIKNVSNNKLKIAVIEGDNILDQIHEYIDSGIQFQNLDTGESINKIKDSICSANIYIDSFIVSEALFGNPDIIKKEFGGYGCSEGKLVLNFMGRKTFGVCFNKKALNSIFGHCPDQSQIGY